MNSNFNNMDLNNNETSFTMIRIIILLVVLQISRILIKQLIFLYLPYSKLNDTLISMFIMLFFVFFIIYKAKREEVQLNVFSYMESNETRNYYILVTVCILLLVLTSPSFTIKPSFYSIAPLLYTIIVIPIYEEILFRSYIWNILKKEYEDNRKIYFINTVLFTIYYIGYVDMIIKASGLNKIGWVLFIKCSLMLSYGIFVGFFRYKFKNSYSCILVHSFINIFGR